MIKVIGMAKNKLKYCLLIQTKTCTFTNLFIYLHTIISLKYGKII